MYQKEYEKTIELMKTAIDCSKDYDNMKRCERNIREYYRPAAWQCLQDIIREYWTQIEFFGFLIDGKTIVENLDPFSRSDDQIRDDLIYLARHIPVYVLMRKGEETLAKKICEWLSGNNGEGR